MKELGGKAGELVGLDLPSAGGGTEAGGNCLSQRRNINAESETADPRRPKWNENQTVLPQPYVPRTGRRAFWKAQQLGAEAWGLWSDPRVGADVDCGETDRGDMKEEIVVGNAGGGKPGSHRSKAILLSCA